MIPDLSAWKKAKEDLYLFKKNGIKVFYDLRDANDKIGNIYAYEDGELTNKHLKFNEVKKLKAKIEADGNKKIGDFA